VQAVNDKLYVTFADLLNPAGGGGGAVDVFDTDGNFQYQLDANGPGPGRLQNPWGITQAPANFGAFSNDLVVGNVAGAGNINAYDPNTHQWLGQLSQPNGTPIAIKGLWDLEFGDGPPGSGKTNQLFFDAGPNHPGDSTGGLLGVIHAAGDQSGNSSGTLVRQAAAPAGETMTVIASVPVAVSNHWLSSSLPNFSSEQGQGSEALSLISKAATLVPASDLQAMEQRIDAFFGTDNGRSASRESRLETMDPQLSTLISMFHADLDAR
jgi:hypothetical protein